MWDPSLPRFVPWDTPQLLHHTSGLESTVPATAGAITHPRCFHRAWCHPNIIPPISGSLCCARVPVQAGRRAQGTCAGFGAQDSPPAPGNAVPKAGSPGRPGRAIASQGAGGSWSSPKALGVCRARSVLGSPGSTYPEPCPRSGARGGLPGHESDSCAALRELPALRRGQAGTEAPAELSQAWDNKQQWDRDPKGWIDSYPPGAFQVLKSCPVPQHIHLPHSSSPVLGETPTCSLPRCSCSLLHNLAERMWDTGAQAPSPPSPHHSPARCLLIEQGGEKNHSGGFFSCFAFQKDSCC